MEKEHYAGLINWISRSIKICNVLHCRIQKLTWEIPLEVLVGDEENVWVDFALLVEALDLVEEGAILESLVDEVLHKVGEGSGHEVQHVAGEVEQRHHHVWKKEIHL